MGLWDKLFKGKASSVERDEYGTWNPMQRQLGQNTFDYLSRIISSGAPTYGGDYTAPLTAGEQEMIARNARLSALAERGLEPLLRGEFPEEYYQKSIYRPLLKQYQEDIQPEIEEQYAGTGGYWGSARAGAVGRGYRDLYDTLAAKRAELGYQAMRDVPNAIQAASQLTATEAATQQIPRLIKQYGLDKQYEEWVRSQNFSQQAIDQALNFLNISTVTERYNPGQPSIFQQVAASGLLGGPIGGVVSDVLSRYPEYGASASSAQNSMDLLKALIGAYSSANRASTAGLASYTPSYSTGYQSVFSSPELGSGNYYRLRSLQ